MLLAKRVPMRETARTSSDPIRWLGPRPRVGKSGRASSVCGGRLAIWCHMARRAGGCRTTVLYQCTCTPYLGSVLFVVITSSVRGKGHHYHPVQYCICTEYNT